MRQGDDLIDSVGDVHVPDMTLLDPPMRIQLECSPLWSGRCLKRMCSLDQRRYLYLLIPSIDCDGECNGVVGFHDWRTDLTELNERLDLLPR